VNGCPFSGTITLALSIRFASYAKAEAEASRLKRAGQSNPRVARIEYTPEPMHWPVITEPAALVAATVDR